MGKLEEAETNLSQVPSSHPHLYAALSRIAQCRGDSLQADFYKRIDLHNLIRFTTAAGRQSNNSTSLDFGAERVGETSLEC